MEQQITDLIVERGRVKAALTRFRTFFDASASTTSVEILEKRLQMNVPLYDKFDAIQAQIETLVAGSASESSHAGERDAFEVAYFDIVTDVERHIGKFRTSRPTSSPLTSTTVRAEAQVTPRLPTIVLPQFDGNYQNWLRFRDTFESLIQNNEALSDIQRFHYLNSALTGSAARVIQSLGVSEANYRLAWSTLKGRFEDHNALIYHHANALIEMPSIQRHSASSLREFIDTINNHILALGALGESVHTWDTLLVLLIGKKLDSATFRKWEERVSSQTTKPKVIDLLGFLEQHSKFLERTIRIPLENAVRTGNKGIDHKPFRAQVGIASHNANKSKRCLLCKGMHVLQQCKDLRSMPFTQLHNTIKQLQCCFNCLELGHAVKNCTRGSCRKCNKKHNTLLHRENNSSREDIRSIESRRSTPTPNAEDTDVVEPPEKVVQTNVNSAIISSNIVDSKQASEDLAILPTALVHIKDDQGNLHKCHALLDVGSQANFITSDLCVRLGLPQTSAKVTVGRLGLSCATVLSRTKIHIVSRCKTFSTGLSCLVIPDITEDMPNLPLSRKDIPIPPGITLADPQFDKPKRIDLLIGAGLFWKLLCIGQHKVGSGFVWQKTRFGWVLGGQMSWPVYQGDIIKANR
ncbi:hypothetical protein ANTRET_LOCUS3619 [Anthophora retusa]